MVCAVNREGIMFGFDWNHNDEEDILDDLIAMDVLELFDTEEKKKEKNNDEDKT